MPRTLASHFNDMMEHVNQAGLSNPPTWELRTGSMASGKRYRIVRVDDSGEHLVVNLGHEASEARQSLRVLASVFEQLKVQ